MPICKCICCKAQPEKGGEQLYIKSRPCKQRLLIILLYSIAAILTKGKTGSPSAHHQMVKDALYHQRPALPFKPVSTAI